MTTNGGHQVQRLLAPSSKLTQSQVAATVLRALGIDRNQFDAGAQPELIESFE
jgi:hypothetical protein